ncbi:restriction endonuclease subunit S [Undibacterium arcticum]
MFTQRGTLGQVSIVPNHGHDRYVVSQSQMKITVDPSKADVNFLYYLFNSPDQLRYIRNSAIQTGVPHTNLGILKKTPVKMPPLAIQKKQVASVFNGP